MCSWALSFPKPSAQHLHSGCHHQLGIDVSDRYDNWQLPTCAADKWVQSVRLLHRAIDNGQLASCMMRRFNPLACNHAFMAYRNLAGCRSLTNHSSDPVNPCNRQTNARSPGRFQPCLPQICESFLHLCRKRAHPPRLSLSPWLSASC